MISNSNSKIESMLDALPVGALQIRIIVICALIAMIDGFDTQAIAFLAPSIAEAWGVSSSAFGPVFGAGLFGGMLGAMAFGAAGDRFGRKPGLLISIALFGLASLATPLVHSMNELLMMRVITGIGLGGAMPSIISLTSEYAPRRIRTTLITSMFCGFPLGAAIGGIGSAALIRAQGWESVFILGGVLPLIVLPIVFWLVPESIRFLLANGKNSQADKVLRSLKLDLRAQDIGSEPTIGMALGSAIGNLFSQGRTAGTVLLWVTFFLSLALTYFLVNWIPTVARQSGFALESAVIGVAMLNLGGILGCIVLGRCIDRFGPFGVITIGYAVGAAAISAIGFATSAAALGIISFLSGFFAIGAQMCVVALAATFYSAEFRATGVGWCMGVGRIGGVAGPIAGGLLVGMGLVAKDIFLFTAAASMLAAISVFLMGRISAAR